MSTWAGGCNDLHIPRAYLRAPLEVVCNPDGEVIAHQLIAGNAVPKRTIRFVTGSRKTAFEPDRDILVHRDAL